ncbi:beta family protein [Sphingopyxis sp.]|uniref:beta family protein n=1 Tax=Sphingopyxis sp. TaxID=1908224 RepID=UPI003D6D4642
MNEVIKPLYGPALRMKQGELDGVSSLSQDVANCVLPRFIVPPRNERDERQLVLLESEAIPDISRTLSVSWSDRPALIDPTYIFDEYGRGSAACWLPAMFERALEAGTQPILAVLLDDIGTLEAGAIRRSLADQAVKLAIRVPSGEMVGPEFSEALDSALSLIGLAPEDCAVIADFGGAEFSEPSKVAPIIGGALEDLQDFGKWGLVIFQGTNYPETNPAGHDSCETWPRNEWEAWRQAVKFDPTTAEHMIFGDYAADCSKMSFGKSGAQAIRHLRYTTSSNWLIQRAPEKGCDLERMQKVCRQIVDSGHFAGSGFSSADRRIHRLANGMGGSGIATNWRQWNTTHHITQVVSDIAKIRGIPIAVGPTEAVTAQLELL